MKRFPLTLLLLALGADAALAQRPPPGPPIEKLATELQLDEYQKGELKRILEEQRAKMEAEREQFESSGQKPTREQMRERMEQAQAELLQQLQSLLTAEQIEKFKKLQEERRERMRDAPPPPF